VYSQLHDILTAYTWKNLFWQDFMICWQRTY